jgi:uncharacterized protein (TIGR02466 family)
MARIDHAFVTPIYQSRLGGADARGLNDDLAASCLAIAAADRAGQRWSKAHGYKGYTSYASLDDLVWRDPAFAELQRRLDRHVGRFARGIGLELERRRLVADSLWINILEPGGHHAAHIHPRSVVSGTYYVATPPGASAIRFEDPRLPLMMAAPARKPAAPRRLKTFLDVAPRVGTVLLWESFLRHEVPRNKARRNRISISFNYRLE